MTMCDQHLTEIYSALLLQINKEHIVVFFPGHFSVAKSHDALPDRHSALFKGKFCHTPFFSKANFATRPFFKGKFRNAPISITSLLPYDLTWSAKSASLIVCDAPTVLDLLERRQRLIDYIN